MHLQTRFLLTGAGLLVVLMTGCGGGDSTPVALLGTKTRVFQPGDRWVYRVTGQGVNQNAQPFTASGSITMSISRQPFNGTTALAWESLAAITTSDGQNLNSDSINYVSQDATTGDILKLGDNNGGLANAIRVATNPQKILFGSWANGLSLAPTLQYDNGETAAEGPLTVVGSETIDTPLGKFTAWKVTFGDNATTEDWAPQLGAPVKITLTLGFSGQGGGGGSGISGTALLESTTVAH